MSFSEVRSLISDLARTDFGNHTVEIQGDKLKIKAANQINLQKINQAVNKLSNLIFSNPDQILKQSTLEDLSEFSIKILEEINKLQNSESSASIESTWSSIANLISQAILYRWNSSPQKSTLSDVLKDLPLDDRWKLKMEKDFVTDDGEIFMLHNLLGISQSFINRYSESHLIAHFEQVLKEIPDGSFVQIQGYPPISKDELRRILEEPKVPLKMLLKPPECIWGKTKPHIQLNPMLILESKVLSSQLKEDESLDELELDAKAIPPKVFALVNKHAGNLADIKLDEQNVAEFYSLARTLEMPTLLRKCEHFMQTGQEEAEVQPQISKTDKILEKIANSENLDEITELVKKLNNLGQKLEVLDLSNFSDMTNEDLGKILQLCPHLVSLDLSGCKELTDDIGPILTKLKSLEELDLSGCDGITDKIGPHLAKLNQLTNLSLVGLRLLTDNIGKHLASLKHLEELDLSTTRVGDTILPSLGKLKELKSLYLTKTAISDDIVEILPKLTKLEVLDLSSMAISDRIGDGIKNLSNLKELYLGSTSISSKIGFQLANLPNLERLDITNSWRVDNEIGPHLAKLHLEFLFARGTAISEQILETLPLKTHVII